MKILVTGASGFLGSFLCEELINAGHQVHAIVRTPKKAWRLENIKDKLIFHFLDFSDQDAVFNLCNKNKYDAIAHLGWSGVANFDRNKIVQTLNIQWSLNLMDAAIKSGVECFLSLGSQAEFGSQSGVLSPESKTIPSTLYGKSKLSTYMLCNHIAKENKLRFVWMRVFSTFGERDHTYWMIPSLIEKLLNKEKPALTAGKQKWDFLYGRDAASAIRLGLENKTAQGIYCLGSGNAPSLKKTIETIRDYIDPSLPLGFGEIPYRDDQVFVLQADTSKLKNDLGWQAYSSLETSLEKTVQWYKNNLWIFEKKDVS